MDREVICDSWETKTANSEQTYTQHPIKISLLTHVFSESALWALSQISYKLHTYKLLIYNICQKVATDAGFFFFFLLNSVALSDFFWFFWASLKTSDLYLQVCSNELRSPPWPNSGGSWMSTTCQGLWQTSRMKRGKRPVLQRPTESWENQWGLNNMKRPTSGFGTGHWWEWERHLTQLGQHPASLLRPALPTWEAMHLLHPPPGILLLRLLQDWFPLSPALSSAVSLRAFVLGYPAKLRWPPPAHSVTALSLVSL